MSEQKGACREWPRFQRKHACARDVRVSARFLRLRSSVPFLPSFVGFNGGTPDTPLTRMEPSLLAFA